VIVYADTSALVKLFVEEEGSQAVRAMLRQAAVLGTGLLARAELGAALARGVRLGLLSEQQALAARCSLEAVWPTWAHVAVDEMLVARAEFVAWQHGLRGYDAVHLASALTWQEHLGRPVVLATYDRALWEATPPGALIAWPQQRP
jgi:predicted nucleic acid-binding protein